MFCVWYRILWQDTFVRVSCSFTGLGVFSAWWLVVGGLGVLADGVCYSLGGTIDDWVAVEFLNDSFSYSSLSCPCVSRLRNHWS